MIKSRNARVFAKLKSKIKPKIKPTKSLKTNPKNRSKNASKTAAKVSSKVKANKNIVVSDKVFHQDLILLKHYYPNAHCALNFNNAYQLLVATVLSAQCTDERVNMVTPVLFERYPDAFALAQAKPSDLELIVRSTGFYTVKSKNLIQAAQLLVKNHGGLVPQSLEQLVVLPGVGRKTANVVLGNAYGIASGVVVDTHVSRLSQRMGWTRETSPEKIERDLIQRCGPAEWVMLSHYLISHGRAICKARSPQCSSCFLAETCPKIGL